MQSLFKEIIDNIGFIVITLIGCLLVINEEMEIGRLLTFTSLLVYFLDPIKNIINLDTMIKEAKNSLKRILDITSYEEEKNGLVGEFVNGDIEFKNLDFSYNDRDYILKDINLKIKKNSKVMVVGESGSGISTLFKILLRFYKSKNNKIFINNIDLNN